MSRQLFLIPGDGRTAQVMDSHSFKSGAPAAGDAPAGIIRLCGEGTERTQNRDRRWDWRKQDGESPAVQGIPGKENILLECFPWEFTGDREKMDLGEVRPEEERMRNEHVYQNLVVQLDKLYRHTRQGSYQTRARYYEAMKRFCGFLADEYHLERLANLAPKHLEAYAAKLQREGKSASTIKTDLSAIRFFHDQMPSPRYQMLPSNSDLELERRSFGKEDRTWTDGEFQRMCALAELDGKEDYVTLFHLARYAGLRIHECFRIDTSMARNAVRCGAITIIGKGGLRRTVSLTQDLRERLRVRAEQTPRGQKLFVAPEEQTHTAIHTLQAYIYLNRGRVQEPGETRDITFHGLRHNFAAEQYQKFRDRGRSVEAAEQAVAELLGHRRRDMARLYLASVGKERNGAAGKESV